MIIGCLCMAVANLIMAVAAVLAGPAGKASWMWLLGYFAVLTLGELYLSPDQSVALFQSLATAVCFDHDGGGIHPQFSWRGISARLARARGGAAWAKPEFFLMIAAIAAASGAGVLLFAQPAEAVGTGIDDGAQADTKLSRAGAAPALHAGAVNVPVYRASTFLFPDLETMRDRIAALYLCPSRHAHDPRAGTGNLRSGRRRTNSVDAVRTCGLYACHSDGLRRGRPYPGHRFRVRPNARVLSETRQTLRHFDGVFRALHRRRN